MLIYTKNIRKKKQKGDDYSFTLAAQILIIFYM